MCVCVCAGASKGEVADAPESLGVSVALELARAVEDAAAVLPATPHVSRIDGAGAALAVRVRVCVRACVRACVPRS